MEFPHLSDTSFPDLRTVDVYQFRNNFDYTRWNENTEIKLVNVKWNSSYTDVVKWDTDALRDAWFDAIDDYHALTLRTAARIAANDGYIKLPLPYDMLARYNYVVVDMPIATSADAPLDYENGNGKRRWYFFINNIRYLSPSATQCYVLLDVWTNYQNSVSIPYMLLERGHAPVSATNTDTYLSNPIANNELLLAPDVTFDNAGITRSNTYVPFGNGTKYVCIASTCNAAQIATLGTVTVDSAYSPSGNITYRDVEQRYGYQLEVLGYGFGNGRNYSDARTPASVGASPDGLIPSNLTVYAIPASEVYGSGATFLYDVQMECPQFLNTVYGCFVVDENCINMSVNTVTVAGHYMRVCVGKPSRNIFTKVLSKSDFNYPSELQRFAKLYTSPYAKIEITDNDGTTFEINVEETTTITARAIVSVAFPFIDERVYFDGIGGIGSTSYTWKNLAGTTDSLEMPKSDWFKYCMEWKIPTYALYMDGENAFMLNSFNRSVAQAIRQPLVNYHNAMRSANTAYENACAQADVACDNATDSNDIALDNAYRSADTAQGNANRNADTQKLNADNAADTAHQNAYNVADTEKVNADRMADNNKVNAYNSASTNKQNAYNAASTNKQNAYNSAGTAHTNSYNDADANKTNAYNSATNAKTIAYDNADLSYTNLDRACTTDTSNQALGLGTTATNEGFGIAASDSICQANNNRIDTDTTNSNTVVQASTGLSTATSTACAVSTATASVQTAALQGAMSGAMQMSGAGPAGIAAGGILGAIFNGLGGAIQANAAVHNNGLTTNTEYSIANLQVALNTASANTATSTASAIQTIQDNLRRQIYLNNQTCAESQLINTNATRRTNAADTRTTEKNNADNDETTAKTNADTTYNTARTNADNNQSTAQTNAGNTETTEKTNADNTETTAKTNADNTNANVKANATDSKTTARTNADNTQTTAKTNAANTQTTLKADAADTRNTSRLNALGVRDVNVANANRTKDNVQNNAWYTRQVAELNNKEILENGKYSSMAAILDARNARPVQIGSYAGNPAPDYFRTRGFQYKVKTQSDSAIRQVGAAFARFGYALNQVWDVATSGLKLMQHFTYWKAAEIWVNGIGEANDNVADFIRNMFMNGVTVWGNPTEIGAVNVYQN